MHNKTKYGEQAQVIKFLVAMWRLRSRHDIAIKSHLLDIGAKMGRLSHQMTTLIVSPSTTKHNQATIRLGHCFDSSKTELLNPSF